MSSSDDHSDEIEQSQREQQRLLQSQIDQSNAEIEQKRQAVFDERLNILRAQSAPNWNPVVPTKSNNQNPPTPGKKNNPFVESIRGLHDKINPLQQRGL